VSGRLARFLKRWEAFIPWALFLLITGGTLALVQVAVVSLLK
jgi:hypothetical protein